MSTSKKEFMEKIIEEIIRKARLVDEYNKGRVPADAIVNKNSAGEVISVTTPAKSRVVEQWELEGWKLEKNLDLR